MAILIALAVTCGGFPVAAAAEGEAGNPDLQPIAIGPDPEDAHDVHVPIAGEEYKTRFMGQSILIPKRNRDNVFALTLGANLYNPEVSDDFVLPIAALYWRHRGENWWTRNIFGLFVNEMDVARSFGRFQLLGHLDNNTVPSDDTEIKDGKSVASTSVIWGTVSGWLGTGYRVPVAPFQADNDFRMQLLYHAGYFYNKRTSNTGSNVRLPPDTLYHGFRLRTRYDGILRNLMELPHQGWAMGGDMELTRRNIWSDSTFGDMLFSGTDTRDYLKLSGYLIGATKFPGLSDRHHLIGYLHGGVSPVGKLDRFSAFRAGGGPFPSESDDLYRLPYPGALFNNFPVSDYVVGTLEYRLQLLFFLYLHLRGTFAWGGNRPDFTTTRGLEATLKSSDGQAFSVGLTSGFLYDSQIYLEYSYDFKLLRNGTDGSSFMILWSKSF